jgi:hypothetical protein
MMNGPVLEISKEMFMAGKRRTGKPPDVLDSHSMDHIKQPVRHSIAIAKMMVCGNRHAVAQPGLPQGRFEIRLEFVSIQWIVCTRSYRRLRF